MNSRNKWIGKGEWDRDSVDMCVASSLLIRHPVLGGERKVWIAVYGSSCWEGQGEWLDAALPGSALLIKSMKLINLWFHMVGSLRFLSLPSFSLSYSHFILFSIPPPMEWCVCMWGWCVFGYYEHWLWFYTSESSSSFPSTFPVFLPLYYLIIYNFALFSPFPLFFPFLIPPLSNLQSTSLSISMSSEQQGRGKMRLGHYSTLAFPCISPTTAATVHREPRTK